MEITDVFIYAGLSLVILGLISIIVGLYIKKTVSANLKTHPTPMIYEYDAVAYWCHNDQPHEICDFDPVLNSIGCSEYKPVYSYANLKTPSTVLGGSGSSRDVEYGYENSYLENVIYSHALQNPAPVGMTEFEQEMYYESEL
jgi:hypothetical protein